MSDLQITLLVLGAVIILGVVLYNWWQERKFRLDMASSFIEPKQEALKDNFEINVDAFEEQEPAHTLPSNLRPDRNNLEPQDFNKKVFDKDINQAAVTNTQEIKLTDKVSTQTTATPHNSFIGDPISLNTAASSLEAIEEYGIDDEEFIEPKPNFNEPKLELKSDDLSSDVIDVEKEPQIAVLDSKNITLPGMIDIQIDLVAMLSLEQDLPGVKLNYALNDFVDLAMQFGKLAQVYALNSDNNWELIGTETTLNKRFSQLVCSLQLVDRGGAINRPTLNRFEHSVELLGLELGSQVEWLSDYEPLNFAQQLDLFCIEVDKIISFHLIQGENGPFHGTKLRGLAEANGFSLGLDGAFHYKEPHHSTMVSTTDNVILYSIMHQNNHPFTVENLRNTVIKGVTFQMDIPRVKNCVEVFKQMVTVAQKMQQGLSAHLVDDLQKPLTEFQINKISQQLENINTRMRNYGIASGSQTALRLFC